MTLLWIERELVAYMDGKFSLGMGRPSGELLEFHATAGSWMGQRLSVTASVCLLWLSVCAVGDPPSVCQAGQPLSHPRAFPWVRDELSGAGGLVAAWSSLAEVGERGLARRSPRQRLRTSWKSY